MKDFSTRVLCRNHGQSNRSNASTQSNNALSNMNLGANTRQTIRCRRCNIALHNVKHATAEWYSIAANTTIYNARKLGTTCIILRGSDTLLPQLPAFDNSAEADMCQQTNIGIKNNGTRWGPKVLRASVAPQRKYSN